MCNQILYALKCRSGLIWTYLTVGVDRHRGLRSQLLNAWFAKRAFIDLRFTASSIIGRASTTSGEHAVAT